MDIKKNETIELVAALKAFAIRHASQLMTIAWKRHSILGPGALCIALKSVASARKFLEVDMPTNSTRITTRSQKAIASNMSFFPWDKLDIDHVAFADDPDSVFDKNTFDYAKKFVIVVTYRTQADSCIILSIGHAPVGFDPTADPVTETERVELLAWNAVMSVSTKHSDTFTHDDYRLQNIKDLKATTGQCVECEKPDADKHCAECGTIYCGIECQKKNWPKHKVICKEVAMMKTSLTFDYFAKRKHTCECSSSSNNSGTCHMKKHTMKKKTK